MEIQYVQVKTRSQFGKQCIFDNEGPTIDENILPNRELMNDYIYRNPCHVGVQNSKQFAVHEVQTTSAPTKETGMSHTEGGWPREVNPKDDEATARFRRRVEKDDLWPIKMKKLLEPMERCLRQNNAVNIYENFFDDMVTTELVLPLDVRTVNVYEDPQTIVRPITHLSWSPDHGKRLAVSYCSMEFERVPIDRNPWSYIWEIENPNKPFMALKATCPSVTIEFNPRDPSMLISGLMSGQVCNWDIRQGNKPVQLSHLQFSHRNPTNLALWINSKTNTEFFSASTGGAMKWWDLRKLREPTETLVMDLENPSRADVVRAIGVSSLQFEPTMGTKFMAGMENGIVVSGTRKGKNAQEKLALRFTCHAGPVIAVDRNPFSAKNFLTVGGWVARIWAEDTREGNLVSSNRDKIALTGGCWSTSRYSVFYLIDESGVVKIYDLLVGMKSPVKTIRLCQSGLKAIAPHEEGRLVAVGSAAGKVYLVESSEALTTNARNDKALMTAYMERCSRYEKAVDNRLKEVRLAHRINYEQIEEPALPTKGKGKGVGNKDARVRDVNANDKRAEDKGTKGVGAIEDRDRKGKIKTKRAKDVVTFSGDPDLVDAETRYFEIINKETEKYAEVAALEEFGDEGVVGRVAKSSVGAEGKRRKQEDSKVDRDTRQGRKRGFEKESRGHGGNEEIVIVRRKKGDTEDERRDEETRNLERTDDERDLDIIIEEKDDDDDEEDDRDASDEKKTIGRKTREDKTKVGPRGKSKKHKRRGKFVKMEEPCRDVCRPEVCCADRIKTKKIREKYEKAVSSVKTSDDESETGITIEEMLINLKKVASPDELGHLLDPIEEANSSSRFDEKLITSRKNARPTLLDEAVRLAKREARELLEPVFQGKSASTRKSKRRDETTRDSTTKLEEIFSTSDYDDDPVVSRDESNFTNRSITEFERISTTKIDDEDIDVPTREREDFSRVEREIVERKKTRIRAKVASDCEPLALNFDEKEIKRIIGVPDAPTPSSRPRFDESTLKVTKTKYDYPRISAAAIPEIEMKTDLPTKE